MENVQGTSDINELLKLIRNQTCIFPKSTDLVLDQQI